MPSKTEEYLALAQRTANGLTRYWESWTDYLTTASRLYKYPFADQLMIYAQRPDATACAEFDIWRNRMNRYVRRGSKGIALLDESSGFPRHEYNLYFSWKYISTLEIKIIVAEIFVNIARHDAISYG